MTEEELYAKMPEWVIGVEDWQRYDGVAYYLDEETGQRYSRLWNPIANDEMCKPWMIYKVECIKDWDREIDYHWKILSSRLDTNE